MSGKFMINSLFLFRKTARNSENCYFTSKGDHATTIKLRYPPVKTLEELQPDIPGNLPAEEGEEFPFEVQIVAENLNIPWAIDISKDGRIYFTERSGTLRMIQNGKLYPEPIISFSAPFFSEGEGGLLGIALDPNFLQNHFIYVLHTYQEDKNIYNRVVRLLEQDNRAFIDQVLIDKIPAGLVHNGGRIKIGPDGKLYISTGDAGNTSLPQNLDSIAGKILRIELDGSIPDDNPFPGSPVYSYGFRNPQGLTWNPVNNIMYATDHGSEAHDEINVIVPGGNYGWPLVIGDQESDEISVQKPLIQTGKTTWAPSGISYLNQGPWQGQLLVGTLRGQQLKEIILSEDGLAVQDIRSWIQGDYGRLREVIQAPDGSIYISTSNRDGRGGIPRPEDDRIIRLVPR